MRDKEPEERRQANRLAAPSLSPNHLAVAIAAADAANQLSLQLARASDSAQLELVLRLRDELAR